MEDALLQTTFLCMGQFLNFLIFSVRLYWITRKSVDHFTKYRNKALRKGKVRCQYKGTWTNKKIHNMSGFKLIHLTLLGIVNSFMQLYCLRHLPLSYFQIMQTSVIIFIPILARIFLKKVLYRYCRDSSNLQRHIYVGMFLTFLGILSVIIASFIHDSEIIDKSTEHYHVYTLLMLAALLLYSFQKIGEEYILQKAEFATRRFVGLQGVIGVGLVALFQTAIILVIFFAGKDKPVTEFLNHFMGGSSLMSIGKSIYFHFTSNNIHSSIFSINKITFF